MKVDLTSKLVLLCEGFWTRRPPRFPSGLIILEFPNMVRAVVLVVKAGDPQGHLEHKKEVRKGSLLT